MVVEVQTTNGRPFLVDDVSVNAELSYTWNDGFKSVFVMSLLRFRWLLRDRLDYPIASVMAGGKQRCLYPHRLVVEAPLGLVVDHINHDTADNRLANLRLATRAENQTSQRDRRTRKSQFVGVRIDPKDVPRRFFATIKKDCVQYHSRRFLTELEAAEWYDVKALDLYGPFARLNFPEKYRSKGA